MSVARLEAHLAGDLARAAAPDEAHWHDFWHEQGFAVCAPLEMAMCGGLAARSLPQVFVAGYQAALRAVFTDLPATGWAAFVAAEDRSDPARFPGTVLTETADGLRMSGCKSWVGQSRHVAHLRVSAMREGSPEVVAVSRDAPGVTITHRDTPSFLAGLSQGFAQFEDVAVEAVPGADLRHFGRTEPLYVMLAGAAFLTAEAADDAARIQALSLTLAIARYVEAGTYAPKTLAALDRSLTALSEAHDGAAIPDWSTDRRLFQMYSPRLQKRA